MAITSRAMATITRISAILAMPSVIFLQVFIGILQYRL